MSCPSPILALLGFNVDTWLEFSEDFIRKMGNRMLMSFFKYGAVREAYPKKCDAIATLRAKLDAYVESGNTELLVDVANYAMIEFMHPKHERAHFTASDSDAEHAKRVWNDGKVTANSHRAEAFAYRREGD